MFKKQAEKKVEEYKEEQKEKPSLDCLWFDEKWSPVLTELANSQYPDAKTYFTKVLNRESITSDDRDSVQPLIEQMWSIMSESRKLAGVLGDKTFLVQMLGNTDHDIANEVRAFMDVQSLCPLMGDEANVALLIVRYPYMMSGISKMLKDYTRTKEDVAELDASMAELCENYHIPLERLEECYDITDPKERKTKVLHIVDAAFDEQNGVIVSTFKKVFASERLVARVEKIFAQAREDAEELGVRAGRMGNVLFSTMNTHEGFRSEVDQGIYNRKTSFEKTDVLSLDEAAELVTEDSLEKICAEETVVKYWEEWILQEAKIGSRKSLNGKEIKDKAKAWWDALPETGSGTNNRETYRHQAMMDYLNEQLGGKVNGVISDSVIFIIYARLTASLDPDSLKI